MLRSARLPGPQANTGVGTITPIVNSTFNVATNQATASPGTPGQTQVIASASGVYSQPFNFETCPVQCIPLQLGQNGQYTDQTSFAGWQRNDRDHYGHGC